jgi:multidrug transporter EmrE-like cation transporter
VSFLPVILYSVLYAALTVSGAALIKTELKTATLSGVKEYVAFLFRFKVITGFAVVFISSLVLIKALSIAKISLVNPVATGVNFMFTLIMGYFVFSERIGLAHYFGLVLILAGIVVISMAERS